MKKQIRKYLNGTANPNEFSEVLEAMCDNEGEDKVTAELFQTWNKTLEEVIPEKENNRLLDRIHYRIALEESAIGTRSIRRYQLLLKVAAVLIVGLMITTIAVYKRPNTEKYTEVKENVTTSFGARTNFKLSDGTEVWLNSGSTISFPKQFSSIRNIELTGQAYFKVVKDGKPFLVKTSYGAIEVMGTSFDVKAYKDEDFKTTLVEGSVKVNNALERQVILKPGQQAEITSTNEIVVTSVKTELTTSWKEGKLIFEMEPFKNVAKELERWYNVKIELQGEKLKKLGYTGTIEMETFGEVLELINVTAPIKYTFNKDTRLLKISGR